MSTVDSPKRVSNSRTYRKEVQKTRAFGEILRQRIDSTLAIQCIHDTIRGINKDRLRFDAARSALNKCLPDLSAVQIAIHAERASTKEDIDALLMEAGLSPDTAFSGSTLGHSIVDKNNVAIDGESQRIPTVKRTQK